MTIEQITKALGPLVAEWPVGTMVWHRANARRALVLGYAILQGAGLKVVVDYGDGPQPENPMVMTAKKPVSDEDGEEWKAGV